MNAHYPKRGTLLYPINFVTLHTVKSERCTYKAQPYLYWANYKIANE